MIRRLILRALGIEAIMAGVRADIEAHGKTIAEMHNYQLQLEGKLGMQRYRVPSAAGEGSTLVLATAKEAAEIREYSKRRAGKAKP